MRRFLFRSERLEPRLLLAADVIISEFMTANQRTLRDDFRRYPDWIELWNRGDEVADLGGMALTDDPDNVSKWQFPSGVTLQPDGYLVVFASGLDTIDGAGSLHTNFLLGADGGYVALVDAQGRVQSEYGEAGSDYPTQFGDVSYGIQGAGGSFVGFMTTPTPGAANSAEVLNIGPTITDVTNRIGTIAASGPLVISANVTQRYAPLTDVQLTYRVNYGDEVTVPMRDDGSGGDLIAADGTYAATIPANAAGPGDLLRWYVASVDAEGRASRAPAFIDQAGEDQSPQYYGTVVTDPAVTSELEVLQWFIEPGQERRADTTRGTRSSLYYLDQLYDNVFVRIRGGSSTGLPKKSYKFDFNTADDFRFSADAPRVTEFNLNTTYTNKDYIRQALAFEVYDQAGVAASEAFPLRVERNGEFYAVSMFVEQPDADLLNREGMDPNGALYKMFNTFTSGTSSVEKKTREYERNDDLVEFVREINALSGDELRNYLFDNVNLPRVLNYLAATVIMQNNDQSTKNYYVYRDSEGTGEWEFLPWDLDLTFGLHFMTNDSILDDTIWADKDNFVTFAGVRIWPSHPFVGDQEHPQNRNWNRLIDALYEVPEIREMHLRRLRTLMDQMLQPPGTPENELKFERRLDEYATQLAQDAALDYQEWASPWRWGQDWSMTDAMQRMKDEYFAVRRQHLYQTHSIDRVGQDEHVAGIPHAQPAVLEIAFGAEIDFAPESGNANEEYFSLVNPHDFAVDLSGWRITGAVEHTLAKGTVIPAGAALYLSPNARAFRARLTGPTGGQGNLVQQIEGNLPNQGGQLSLLQPDGSLVATANYLGTVVSPQQALRITEINYNPFPAMPAFGELDTDNDSYEFVEITNTGSSAVDLTGARLVEKEVEGDNQGITYTFETGMLDAGARVVVVKGTSAFTSRYGVGLNIAGEFEGKLSNGGELLTLLDAAGDLIQAFRYNDRGEWPGLADGDGASLELIDAGADPSNPANWQASRSFGGSPGRPPELEEPSIVINEVLSASTEPAVDVIELFNAGNESVSIAGWYLSDASDFAKFRFPADEPMLAAGAYRVIDQNEFGFGLKGDDDDDLRLVMADASGRPLRFVDYVEFPAAADGVSFGRWPNGVGVLQPMMSLSFGAANPGPAGGLTGDWNGDSIISADDIDQFCADLTMTPADPRTDLNADARHDEQDLLWFVQQMLQSTIGDSNLDGVFTSSDLVAIFQTGEYEDSVAGNSTWATGDWNCDGEFSSRDLVFAFQIGDYRS